MGKWCLVACNCPNRNPLGPYDSRWGQYECGHEDGAILACWPGGLISLGNDLGIVYRNDSAMFPIFRRIGDWRNYGGEAEYLNISVEDAQWWQLEIEQLEAYLAGTEYMGWQEQQTWEHLREEERQRYARTGREPTPIAEILALGRRLCEASAAMQQPIEFFW